MSSGSSTGTSAKTKQRKKPKITDEVYQAESFRLQTEFVRLQEWVRYFGARIVVIFEGRDGAGKGGAIKRITEYLNPRVAGSRCSSRTGFCYGSIGFRYPTTSSCAGSGRG